MLPHAEYLAHFDAEKETGGNRLFYVSTPPSAFPGIVERLGQAGLNQPGRGGNWARIVLEKPVGSDFDSARAINDYVVEFDRDELTEEAPIVARMIDGEAFGIRENGPLWVVYPYDSGPEYQTELVYARSIWQLVELTVETR